MLIPILTFLTGVVFGIFGKVMYDKSSFSDAPTTKNGGSYNPDERRKR